MRVYLDMCCLKRPFDDQSQARVRMESEAVLGILASEGPGVEMIRSGALVLDNEQNPVRQRAARVGNWLREGPAWVANAEELGRRTAALMGMGFRNFDAIHVASAELAGAEMLGTCDDRLLATARRNADRIRVRVVGVLELAREVVR